MGGSRERLPQILCGGALMSIGGVAAYVATAHYGVGQLTHLGAGAFPLLLGLVLAGLGGLICFASDAEPEPLEKRHWLGALAIFGSIAVFALTLQTLGLVPAIFLLTFISSAAEPPISILRTLALATALSAAAYLIFVVGLRLPLDAFSWL